MAQQINTQYICCVYRRRLARHGVLYNMAILTAMLVCLITYSIYIQSLVDFQPQVTYEVYDSLEGAQARLLLPKKQDPSTYNGEVYFVLH